MTRSIPFEYFTVLSSRKTKMNYIKRLGVNKYAAKIKADNKIVASLLAKIKNKNGHV